MMMSQSRNLYVFLRTSTASHHGSFGRVSFSKMDYEWMFAKVCLVFCYLNGESYVTSNFVEYADLYYILYNGSSGYAEANSNCAADRGGLLPRFPDFNASDLEIIHRSLFRDSDFERDTAVWTSYSCSSNTDCASAAQLRRCGGCWDDGYPVLHNMVSIIIWRRSNNRLRNLLLPVHQW